MVGKVKNILRNKHLDTGSIQVGRALNLFNEALLGLNRKFESGFYRKEEL